ncbi:actin-related protein 6 [Ochromonadaceae sp. CCMP2298]|nr:actin-related protein 6 [Ochromonadaceae sp. CCMP2298]|mmetsp:Transcript_13290/g.29732  ORF Transcript_13290/g.29732 Transcript_13290/m.29732 type:complete len:418 (+) Transcript_13290:51-1304(+)|eukprot:CAMPEP_0173179198 /NCGR_PEP_ID=MMETSP1141-20130122/5974_1 /TAXON_ID=483371 /ORGANISM="non described non described, Strain CCMP2298" /LENGTH=417 /DNA_ID=CAMNT_0014101805 /DNA_START=784 /DNA_END=2037 /DNA_ORIENTATION=-
MSILVIDNGAGNIKAGLDHFEQPLSIANVSGKIPKSMQYLVSDQVYDSRSDSQLSLSRPYDRGYLTNWQCEIDIWTYLLNQPTLKGLNASESSLVLTEPPLNPVSLQNDANEVVFEYFGFKEYVRRPAAWFSMYEFSHNEEWNKEGLNSCTVVDSGFSFTHSLPFINQLCQKPAIRRVNVGGKLLTNYLKELVSYRQWNMMDEFLLMNQVKENLCYVSSDFLGELTASKVVKGKRSRGQEKREPLDWLGGKLRKSFVLPDFQKVMKGFVKPDEEGPVEDEQILMMETERFTVPELLFNPSDIEIDQAGVAEATWQSLQALDPVPQGLAASAIILTGGNASIPQYLERFRAELRPFVPDTYPVEVYLPQSPELYAWLGAARFAQNQRASKSLQKHMVTKAQFMEYGSAYCNEKFASGW